MKILHVLSGRKVHEGIDVVAMDTILALHERNVDQFVVCRPHESFLVPLSEIKIPVAIVDFNKWNKWLMKRWIPRQVHRNIRSYVPDVIHCWGNRSTTFIPRRSGIPVLAWDANNTTLEHNDSCDYYICINRQNIEDIKTQTKRPDCVFLGYPFGTLLQDTPLSREEFGIPNNKPIILMLARMHPIKGVDVLLRACVGVDAFLLLAGTGSELENYHKLAQDLGIESRVRFIGWRNDRSALLELADVLALPSRSEGFGKVMVEAWSKDIPVVASRTDGPGEYIQHGVNGMLSDIEDIDGLTKNLRAVLEDNALRSRLIAGGACSYESQFSKEVVISKLLSTYEEIIRKGVIKNQ